jgi:hypothetical protein
VSRHGRIDDNSYDEIPYSNKHTHTRQGTRKCRQGTLSYSLGMEDGVGEEQAANPGFALRRRRGKITPEDAVTIYLAQDRRTPKTASLLAVQYGITSKAVRDIWCEQTSSTQVAAAVQPQHSSVGHESVGHACETRSR